MIAAAAALSLSLAFLPFHFAFAGAIQTLAPVTNADGRLGLCEVLPGNTPNGTPWAQLAFDAGVRISRREIRWDRVEPRRNTWSFTADDAAVQSDGMYGLETLGILIGTPAWATAAGQPPGDGVPRGLYLKYTDPGNLWADYVRQTVSHYKGQVGYWEIWNEPDLSFFWKGTPGDYVRLLKVAALTIADTDPNAKVVMAGMVVPDLSFLQQVLDAIAQDPAARAHHGYFDIAAWHAYGSAKALYGNVLALKALLQRKGYGSVPLWVTEDGFSAAHANGEQRQAAYVLQSIAYAMAAGAARILVYRSSDDTSGQKWGLLSASGQPRMGYVAYQVAARYFAHAQAVSYSPEGGLERFVMYRPNDRLTVLWNRGLMDSSVDVPADGPAPTFVDWMGQPLAATQAGDDFHLSVPGASYNKGVDPAGSIVGGPPLLVDQDNTDPANLAHGQYLAALAGAQRHLVLFNGAATPIDLKVSAAAHPREREVAQIAPHAMRSFDLDLLAGNSYRGMYAVSSSAPLVGEGTSDQTAVPLSNGASTWYMAVAPAVLTIGNGSDGPVTTEVTAFGARGVVRARTQLDIRPGTRVLWTAPSAISGKRFALVVQATGPIVVSGAGAVPAAQTTWYVLHPRTLRLAIFNPDPSASTQVDARFVGSPTIKGEQIQVTPRRSYLLAVQGAKAVVVTADRPVAVGYRSDAASGPLLASGPATESSLPVVGEARSVALYNPASEAAHVTLSLVSGTRTRQVSKVLMPSKVYTVHVRTPSQPAAGVVISSDIPVVSAPS